MTEQGVRAADEWDGRDERAQHFLVLEGSDPIGCARIVRENRDGRPSLHIGRVAIVRHRRGRGAGRQLMRAVLDWCGKHEPRSTPVLDAQCTMIGFYERLAFEAHGPVFLDAGIEHRAMTWRPQSLPSGGGF